jgi:hypothetical protein
MAAAGEPVASMEVSVELAAIELMYACPACGAPMPVNVLASRCACSACLAESELPEAVWQEAFENIAWDVVNHGFGYLHNGPTWDKGGPPPGPHVAWLRGHDGPPCPQCAERMVADLEQGVCRCRACGETRPIIDRPAGVAEGRGIAGYVSDEPAQPHAPEPVTVACTACGGPLEADGSSRTVRCRFCAALVVLSDGVWTALHPPRRKHRWWVVMIVAPDPRRARLSAWREAKHFVPLLVTVPIFWLPLIYGLVGDQWGQPKLALAILDALLLLIVGSWAWRAQRFARVCTPSQEVVGHLRDRQGGSVDVVLTMPGQPEQRLGWAALYGLSEQRFRELGGPGGRVRAWMLPGKPESAHVEPMPSVYE